MPFSSVSLYVPKRLIMSFDVWYSFVYLFPSVSLCVPIKTYLFLCFLCLFSFHLSFSVKSLSHTLYSFYVFFSFFRGINLKWTVTKWKVLSFDKLRHTLACPYKNNHPFSFFLQKLFFYNCFFLNEFK